MCDSKEILNAVHKSARKIKSTPVCALNVNYIERRYNTVFDQVLLSLRSGIKDNEMSLIYGKNWKSCITSAMDAVLLLKRNNIINDTNDLYVKSLTLNGILCN